MPESQPRRRTCLTVVILGSPIVLSLLILVGFAAWMLVGEISLKDFLPEEPATEYSEEVVRIREEVEAELEAARNRLEHDLANLPPECSLPEGWRLETMLENAWFHVEQKTIRDLACSTFHRFREEEGKLENHFEDLSKRLGVARIAGNATSLEMRFEPRERSPEEVLRDFREYVLQAEYLDQLEIAIDHGVARYVPEVPYDLNDTLHNDTLGRLRVTAWLLKLRVLYALEEDNLEDALKTCFRLHRLARHETVPFTHYYEHNAHVKYADESLALIMSYGSIPEKWRERFETEHGQRFEGHDLKKHVLAQSVCEAAWYRDKLPMLPKHEYTNRVFARVRKLTEMLETPLVEYRADIHSFLVEIGIEDTEDEEKYGIRAFFRMLRSMPDLIVGMQLHTLPSEIANRHRLQFSVDVARTAFALEDYRAEHGQYPANLEALAPEFPDAVPVDPVFGVPLGYTRNEDGYELTLQRTYQFSWNPSKAKEEEPEYTTVWEVRRELFSHETP